MNSGSISEMKPKQVLRLPNLDIAVELRFELQDLPLYVPG